MPAVPAIIMGGSAIGSALISHHAATSAAETAAKRSPEETALMQAQTGLANTQRSQGEQTFNRAMPAINSTMQYYRTLLNGNRAARMGAVAPEAEDTAAAYSGADKAIKRSNISGGERDQAIAENARARAGQIARLVTGVRPQAAAATGGLGTSLLGASGGFEGGAGNIFADLLGNASGNRLQANQVGREAGSTTASQIGSLLADLIKSGAFGKMGQGGGGTLPGQQTVWPIGTLPDGGA